MHPHPNPLLILPRCKTLNHLKSLHAQLTLHSVPAALYLPKLLFTLTYLPSLPSTLSLPYAVSLFNILPSPSTLPFNLLIRLHTLSSLPIPALRYFSRMRRSSVPPDPHTFPFALTACSRLPSPLPLARSLHCQSLKFGFTSDVFLSNTLIRIYASSNSLTTAQHIFNETPFPDIVSYNTLIDGYVKVGDIGTACKLFDDMPERDMVSWGTLLSGYSQTGRYRDGVQLFDQMMGSGLKPDDVATVSALSCCAQLGELERGKAIHEYVRRNRFRVNVYLSTGLVDMYVKCGCVDIARVVFEKSECRNLFTWNAIIVGLGMNGDSELSLEYFYRMVGAGVRPDGVSFLGVLVGCSHGGFTDTARKLFGEMERVYGVDRELKHYGCMADILGRAGMVDQVMVMIKGMPMEGDAYVWGGVLTGCRICGNADVADIAARHLLALNPGDSGVYSILADIYATAGRWDDVVRIRRTMDDNIVIKNTGYSSIQVQGSVAALS